MDITVAIVVVGVVALAAIAALTCITVKLLRTPVAVPQMTIFRDGEDNGGDGDLPMVTPISTPPAHVDN